MLDLIVPLGRDSMIPSIERKQDWRTKYATKDGVHIYYLLELLKIPSTVYVEINDRPDYHGIGQKNWNTETANYI